MKLFNIGAHHEQNYFLSETLESKRQKKNKIPNQWPLISKSPTVLQTKDFEFIANNLKHQMPQINSSNLNTQKISTRDLVNIILQTFFSKV